MNIRQIPGRNNILKTGTKYRTEGLNILTRKGQNIAKKGGRNIAKKVE